MIKVENDSKFKFKQFELCQDVSAMKVGSDGILLGAWARKENAERILDIGSGCGLIALMAAQLHQQAKITGIEIDQGTAAEAASNAAKSPFADRLQIICSAIQDFAEDHQSQYDLIISNPPFFSGGTLSHSASRDAVRHTTKLSHGDLLASVRSLLSPSGRFDVILPVLEGMRFIEHAITYGFHPVRKTIVYGKEGGRRERILLSLAAQAPKKVVETQLALRTAGGHRSPGFQELTAEFYLSGK